MKPIYITLILALVTCCKKDDVKPLIKIEANIGEPFTVSAPAEISFKETGVKLFIDNISNYMHPGFNSPVVTAKIRYNDSSFDLLHSISCKSDSCNPEIALDDLYSLKFEKVLATSKITDHDAGADLYRVDSAQFVLSVN